MDDAFREFAGDTETTKWHMLPDDFRAASLLNAGWPIELVTGLEKPKAHNTATTKALVACRDLRHCSLVKSGQNHPSLAVRYDQKVSEHLQPILLQCVTQCQVLLEKCQNYETLKHWIKFPLFTYPQWEDHFAITCGVTKRNWLSTYIMSVRHLTHSVTAWQ